MILQILKQYIYGMIHGKNHRVGIWNTYEKNNDNCHESKEMN